MGEPRLTQTIIGWGIAIAIVIMAYLSGTDGYTLDWHIMLLLIILVFILLYGKGATVEALGVWRGGGE